MKESCQWNLKYRRWMEVKAKDLWTQRVFFLCLFLGIKGSFV